MGTKEHRVQQGECLESIAHAVGAGWKDIWELPENAELRRTRKAPNVLLPGDVVHVPDKAASFTVETGKRHTFVASRCRTTLLDVVIKASGKAVAAADCVVLVQGLRVPARIDERGRLRLEIAPNARRATVVMADGSEVELHLGQMDPIDELSGVQGRLVALGYGCGDEDGQLGPGTRQALFHFQKDSGMKPTGDLDTSTRAKLQQVFGS